MSDTDDRYQRVNLRLPRDLHAKLMAEAEARSRSMNAEVVARLEGSFAVGVAEYEEEIKKLLAAKDRVISSQEALLSTQRVTAFFISGLLRDALNSLAQFKDKIPSETWERWEEWREVANRSFHSFTPRPEDWDSLAKPLPHESTTPE